MKSKTKTQKILKVMNLVAWIIFIGYLIETGAVLVSFGVSLFNPEAAKNLYMGLDLHELYLDNLWHYIQYISLIMFSSFIKAYIWYLIISILTKISLDNPFKMVIANKLEKIGYLLVGTWISGCDYNLIQKLVPGKECLGYYGGYWRSHINGRTCLCYFSDI